jgi:RNA polymerase subunit RPABC4/transcription elongation factor Spt4
MRGSDEAGMALEVEKLVGTTRVCPSCGLGMAEAATKCPHCQTDHAKKPWYLRSVVYLPFLSLVVAAVGLTPGLLGAIKSFRSPPKPQVLATQFFPDQAGLILGLANFGAALGVLDERAYCDVLPIDKLRTRVIFLSASRPVLRPDSDLNGNYDAQMQVFVDWQGQSRMYDPSQPIPIAMIRSQLNAARHELTEGSAKLLPEQIDLNCSIQVQGKNEPSPVTLQITLNNLKVGGGSDPVYIDQLSWSFPPLNP